MKKTLLFLCCLLSVAVGQETAEADDVESSNRNLQLLQTQSPAVGQETAEADDVESSNRNLQLFATSDSGLPQLPLSPLRNFGSNFGLNPNADTNELFPRTLDPLNVLNRGGSCNLIMRKDKKTHGIDGGQVSYSKKPCGRGTVAFMSCNNGCSFVGYDPTITVLTASCDNDNNGMIGWRFPKDRQPYCDYVRCDDIGATVRNGGGQITYSNDRLLGSSAQINCNAGCGFSGGGASSTLTLQCLPGMKGGKAQWTTSNGGPLPDPICQVQTCPYISNINQGIIQYVGNLSPSGQPINGCQAKLKCKNKKKSWLTSCYVNAQGQAVWSSYAKWSCV